MRWLSSSCSTVVLRCGSNKISIIARSPHYTTGCLVENVWLPYSNLQTMTFCFEGGHNMTWSWIMTVNRKDASRAKCDKWKRQKYFVLHSSLAVLFEEQQSNANKKTIHKWQTKNLKAIMKISFWLCNRMGHWTLSETKASCWKRKGIQ